MFTLDGRFCCDSAVRAIASIVALLIPAAACLPAPTQKTAFNAAEYPVGEGWYCYDSHDGGDCDRSEAECVHKRHSANARSACTKREAVYCFSLPTSTRDPSAKRLQICSADEAQCREQADFQSRRNQVTECGRVP